MGVGDESEAHWVSEVLCVLVDCSDESDDCET